MKKMIKLASKSDISPGEMRELKVGNKTIVIADVKGKYLVFDGLCTHKQCPLAGGLLEETILTCYCHGAKFDIKSGKVLAPPAETPLNIYKVKVEKEDIFIEI